MVGSKYWAKSFVRLVDGRKIFLSTSYSELKRLMNNNDDKIEVEKSGIISDALIVLLKSNISEYGEYSFL